MIQTFKATLSPMLIMFLCIVLGFVCNKKKILPENSAIVLSKLETNIIVPCLVIKTFMTYCTISSLNEQYKVFVYSIIACLISIFIAAFLSKFFVKDGYGRNIYKYAIAFANSGYMGNAIVQAILGDEMLYRYMLYTLPINVAIYSWGIANLVNHENEDKKQNPLKKFLNPIFFAIIIGAIFGLIRIQKYVPSFINTTISNFSVCMGPIAMFLTGFVIGDYNILKLIKNKKVYVASVLRLIIIPSSLLIILKLLGADETILKFCLFAHATPLGLNTVVIPAAYGGDTDTGASMAMISHTLCVITIPIMFSILTTII